jgi:hypothetical protein
MVKGAKEYLVRHSAGKRLAGMIPFKPRTFCALRCGHRYSVVSSTVTTETRPASTIITRSRRARMIRRARIWNRSASVHFSKGAPEGADGKAVRLGGWRFRSARRVKPAVRDCLPGQAGGIKTHREHGFAHGKKWGCNCGI